MLISTSKGFAFLCTPKCASTSIEEAIRDICNIKFSGAPGIKHINARQFSTHLAPLLKKIAPAEKIESFCLFRDPFDWIESWYRYRTRDEVKATSHPRKNAYTGNISYNEFIEAYLSEKSKRPAFAALGTQFDFVRSHSGGIEVDHIFQLDRLDMVCEFLSEKTGARFVIPLKNVSPKMTLELDAGLKTRLLGHFRKDIALFNFIKAEGAFHRSLHAEKFQVA
jgi:hypothetical protein